MAPTKAISGYDRMKEAKEFDESKIGVKGLVDSGITTIPKMFIHPPETLSDLKNVSRNSSVPGIPIIDLSDLKSPIHRPKIVEQVRDAASTWGFFQVVNHGVPVSVMDNTISAIKAFHEQPKDVKAKYYVREGAGDVKFQSNNDLFKSPAASWHDSLLVKMGPVWPNPEEIPEVCRKEVMEWGLHATEVADTVEELLSEGLGLEADKFKELSFSEFKYFAGTCYPYCPQADLTMGIAPHTDAHIVTVLLSNQVPGLQVKHGDEWVDVKSVPGGLIINVGDFLQVVSNDKYQSVQHRVLANSCKEMRISVIIFFGLSEWRESDTYGPLPELLSPGNPAVYRDFSKQEFLNNIYAKGFDSKTLPHNIRI